MKKGYRVLLFSLILLVFLSTLSSVFRFKDRDGIYSLDRFYEQEQNMIDVLIAGSSHASVDIDPSVLYNQAGLATYTLWGSGQPIWNTYFYLKEALEYQSPRLVVLEAFTLFLEYDYADESGIIKNTYGLKDWKRFTEAIKVSAPKDQWLDYCIKIGQWHSRYLDLKINDFVSETGFPRCPSFKGSELLFATDPNHPMPDLSQYNLLDCSNSMTDKCEEYFRKCIELLQSKNIPMLVVVSPFPVSEHQSRVYEEATAIAAEYGVETVNGNLLYTELGLDFSTDIADANHLNYSGAYKWTSYLAEYIQGHFSLPDRRGDPKYSSWEENARIIDSMRSDMSLLYTGAIDQYLDIITQETGDYEVVVLLNGDYLSKDPPNITTIPDWATWLNEKMPIRKISPTGSQCLLLYRNHQWEIMEIKKEITVLNWDNNELVIKKDGDSLNLYYNSAEAVRVKDGINFVVYNSLAQKLADIAGFNAPGNYNKL